jgi:hypothetical protein
MGKRARVDCAIGLLTGLVLFLRAALCPADTIVLKNGRVIVAESVTERGGRVTYEGEAGRVSIPRSMVERIERGGFPPPRSSLTTGVTSSQPAELDSVPQIRLSLQGVAIDRIVREGAVDDRVLAELASQARDGELQRQNAVNAFLIAATYETGRQRLAEASRWAEQAVLLSPRDSNALLIAADVDLARRQYREALSHLLVAQSVAPQSPDVLTLLGNAYYFSDGAGRAVWYWKQAQAIRPSSALQERIDRAEQEADVETRLLQTGSYHFALSWEGSAVPPGFAREILEVLERQFTQLQNSFNYSPSERVPVILYSSMQFADITRAPRWAGAVNDGKIRIPVQGLNSLSQELARVLKHELVHSFIFQITEGRCPTWLNEGIAQMEAGEPLDEFGPGLAQVFAATSQIPLAELEGSFERFDTNRARLAYGESLAAAELLRERYGAFRLSELLEALRSQSVAGALPSVLRLDYSELEAQLGDYVRQRYGR